MSEEVLKDIEEWREQHPKATFRETEEEIDQRLSGLRAKMLSDTASLSVAADWDSVDGEVKCPRCGMKLEKKGKKKPSLQAQGAGVFPLGLKSWNCCWAN